MSKTTCKVELRYPIGKIVERFSGYVTDGVLIEPTESGSITIATNGKIMAVCPADGHVTCPMVAPAQAFVAKASEAVVVERKDEWSKTITIKSGRKFPPRIEQLGGDVEGRFPRWRDALPDLSGKPVISLTLDVKLLARLTEVLKHGSDNNQITLLIPTDKLQVVDAVPVLCDSEAFGLIMPCIDDLGNGQKRYENAVKKYASRSPKHRPSRGMPKRCRP